MQFLAMKQFALQTSQVGAKYQRGDDKPMFVSYVGNAMTASNAAKSIRQALGKSGALAIANQADPKFTATMVRKLITTLVREDEPELAEPLAQQLSHSSKTGADNYQLKMKQRNSAKMVKMIASSVEAAARRETAESVSQQMEETSESIEETSQSTVDSQSTAAALNDADNHTKFGAEMFDLPSKADFVRRMAEYAKREYAEESTIL